MDDCRFFLLICAFIKTTINIFYFCNGHKVGIYHNYILENPNAELVAIMPGMQQSEQPTAAAFLNF